MRRVRVVALLAAVLVAAPTAAAAATASPEERAAATARPAVVFVQVDWHGWVRDPHTREVFGGAAGYHATTLCSGAIVQEDGYVVTAGHCVDPGPGGGGGALIDLAVADLGKLGRVRDPAKASAQLAANAVVEGAVPGSAPARDIQVQRVVGTSGLPARDVAPATVVGLRTVATGDVALLKVPRGRLPAIAVTDADDLAPGAPVLAIGYPAAAGEATDPSLEPSNKNGQISTRRSVSGNPYYEVSAAASQGMSGGPVVDMDGRLIGLVAAAPRGETQSFNLVTASTSVAELLRRSGVDAATTANDRNFAAGIEHYFDGDYAGAVAFFDAVLASTPAHAQAAEYRRLAAEREDGGWDLMLVLIVGCGAVAVATAATGAALLVLRRYAARYAGTDLPTPPFGIALPGTAAPAPEPRPGGHPS